MNFESRITTLKAELTAKYPITKAEEMLRVNDQERRLELINKIQMIIKSMTESVAADKFPAITTIVHTDWGNCFFDERELYYENVKIFKSQKQVDRGMKELCYLLSAPSWELRISGVSKGFLSGPVVLTLANGETVDCQKRGGVCIPQDVLQIEKISTSAKWVLIVEKEASFQSLIGIEGSGSLDSCILITGKGFPDVNSRLLVCKFWEILRIPILALVDADPHGFEIMCVYRFGSASMSSFSGFLACPAVRWLGVHPSDIRPLLLDSKVLSRNDERKINFLLKRPYVEKNETLKAQLRTLLEGNAKAEIEGVTNISANYLVDVRFLKSPDTKRARLGLRYEIRGESSAGSASEK